MHPPEGGRARSGFTLFEALVALALVVAFSATVGPNLFQARRIMDGAEGRAAAQVLMRSLLAAPLDRAHLQGMRREGETAGLHWRLSAEPIVIDAMRPPQQNRSFEGAGILSRSKMPTDAQANWTTFRVIASVSWGRGRAVTAETVRLGEAE